MKMFNLKMKCSLIRSTSKAPVRKTDGAAGFDLCYDGEATTVRPQIEPRILPTGVILEIEKGSYGQIAPRSGLAIEYGVIILGGIIDSDYRGEVKVVLKNTGGKDWLVQPGDRIAQLLILPCYQDELTVVDSVNSTDRGEGGFGSTGK